MPLSVQLLLPRVPVPLFVHVTLPVGALALPADVSLTVAVHVVGWPRLVGFGKHTTAVLVLRFETWNEPLVAAVRPELDAASV